MKMVKMKGWVSKFKRYSLYAFICLVIAIAAAVFGIISYTSNNAQSDSRRIFESSLWNTLQLQIQIYQFSNHLLSLDQDSDSANHEEVFAQYEILMSRVDLLREGDVGNLIRDYEEGRITRLLNIINGELELLSYHTSKVSQGDMSYAQELMTRLKKIELQSNELTALINKGSTEFIEREHETLQARLFSIKALSVILLIGLLLLCFLTLKKLTALRKAKKLNRSTHEKIKTFYEDRANIISFIHQEIRSPAHAILGIAKRLQKSANIDSPHALSLHLEESGQQLLQTIDMVSDFSLVDANKLTLKPSTKNLRKAIEGLLETLSPQISRRSLQSILYVDPELPAYVTLDFERVKEVITAFIQNAIAHTPSGSISIHIRPTTMSVPISPPSHSTGEIRMLQIVIKDTGNGIPVPLQNNLRPHASTSIEKEPTLLSRAGFNLALCYKLVSLMKGEIHFSSDAKNGSEFWIDIPFHVANNKESALETSNNRIKITAKQALLIEVDNNIAHIMKHQLAELDIETIRLTTTSHQIHKYENYDFIILGNMTWSEYNEAETIQQWNQHNKPIIRYQTEANNDHKSNIASMAFPLTQSQLEKVISNTFHSKKA